MITAEDIEGVLNRLYEIPPPTFRDWAVERKLDPDAAAASLRRAVEHTMEELKMAPVPQMAMPLIRATIETFMLGFELALVQVSDADLPDIDNVLEE